MGKLSHVATLSCHSSLRFLVSQVSPKVTSCPGARCPGGVLSFCIRLPKCTSSMQFSYLFQIDLFFAFVSLVCLEYPSHFEKGCCLWPFAIQLPCYFAKQCPHFPARDFHVPTFCLIASASLALSVSFTNVRRSYAFPFMLQLVFSGT